MRKYVANLWGEAAGYGANLFLILKRRFDRASGRWGAFAFVPYATELNFVPASERLYQGLHGGDEYGTVVYCGFVRDSRSASLSEDQLAIAQGIAPNMRLMHEMKIAASLPVMDVAIHRKLRPVLECY